MRVLKLPRSTKPGTIIYRLKGSDSDAESLTFGVKGQTARKLLEVKSVTFNEADVYLKGILEDEEYKINLFVSDGHETTTVESKIMVTEVEEPTRSPFVDLQTLFTVKENADIGATVGYVEAKEKADSNLAVTFELRGSETFAIKYVFGPKGVSKAVITLTKHVDYEKQNLYVLTVVALNAWINETVDTRNIFTTRIVTVVEDVEDTPPRFRNLPQMIKLTENVEKDSVIATIKAEDGDYGINRPIEYSIIEDKHKQNFSINKTSGELMVLRTYKEFVETIGNEKIFLLKIEAKEVKQTESEESIESNESNTAIAEVCVVLIPNNAENATTDTISSPNNHIQKAALVSNSDNMILWILIGLILITILFILCLMCVFCIYCRPNRRRSAVKSEVRSTRQESLNSDSGIGVSPPDKRIELNNKDVMNKKSIFTIAYDGVRTNRIGSADSIPSSP
ncbi:cadherin-86C-like protein [Leptotrombidium deliense]|uniref:Cadherin-86C-like protein n=1 Tax=Leptotrombidium deliense TaxID=299467 RepID=A0A443SFH4_9ACAR|nr:cadherin-86C-like protein [Leptotrombidium deliense]